jgi:hypothetical protein
VSPSHADYAASTRSQIPRLTVHSEVLANRDQSPSLREPRDCFGTAQDQVI